MKTLILLAGVILLTACSLGTSREVKLAEKMLSHFQCNKIETAQMTHNGEQLFDMPLTEVIEQQYVIYKAACQNLGGIEPTFAE